MAFSQNALNAPLPLTTANGGLGINAGSSTGFPSLASGSTTVAPITIVYNFNQAVTGNGTIVLSPYIPFGCTITEVYQIQSNSGGSCTANFQINTTSITSLSALSVTSSPQNVAATGANTVASGNALNLIITSASSLTQLIFSLAATRTS